jgi:hypothetical protein
MSGFRRACDRAVDLAHSELAGAEMLWREGDPESQGSLERARRYLATCIAARDAWNARPADADEYERFAAPDLETFEK